MPVSIPDFPSVGFDDPRAAGNLPVYPANDAGAEGMATLGKGIDKAGTALADLAAQGEYKRQRLNEANATTDLFNRIVPLHAQISKETDPEKLAELKSQYGAILQTSAQAIDDPLRQRMWIANHSKTIAEANAEADKRGTDLYRNQAVASGLTRIDQAVRLGANADDPNAMPNAQAAIAENLHWMGQAGAMTPEQAHAQNKQAQKQLIEGRVLRLTDQGKTAEATALLEQNYTELDPITHGNLQLRIDAKGRKNNADGAALRALGLPTIGIGNLPTGTPSTGGLSVGGAIPQTISNEAARQNVSTNLALTTAQIESSMGQNLGSRGNIFQLGRSEWSTIGGGRMGDAGTDIRNGVAWIGKTESELADALGRQPNGAEVYLAHQQGVAGATKLLSNPGIPAGQLVPAQNISANGGDPNAPASAFVNKWQGTFNRTSAELGSGPPAAGASSNIEVWGDSLGVGLKGQLKGAGTVVGGITPTAIFNNIKAQPADYWQGKTVALPSGSNGNEMPVVEDTIKYLKGNGANVIAVGYGPKFPEKNATLAEIAARQQVPVIAAEGVGASEGVHPSPAGYRSMAQKIGALAAGPDQLATSPAPPGAQPIPTGEPASSQPPVAMQPAPQNRTGLPSLAQAYQNILRDPAVKTDQDVRNAFATATAIHNQMEADAARAERIQTQADQQHVRDAENEAWKDVYSATPKITASQVAVDPRYNSNPERRKQIIELINNPPGSAIPAPQSYAAAQAVIDRIRLPYGDENKITTRDQIYDLKNTMNRADVDYALQKLTELSSPGEHPFGQRLDKFFSGIDPQIDKSGALPGLPSDSKGKAKAYEFRRMVEDQVAQYRKDGKNPDDLINPKSSAYLGNPETLRPFKRTMTEALADFSTENEGPLGAGGIDLTTIPNIKAAIAAGKITWEQGQGEVLKRGLAVPNPAPAASGPALSAPLR